MPTSGGERKDFVYDFPRTRFGRIAMLLGVFTVLFGVATMNAHGSAPFVYGLLTLLSLIGCVCSIIQLRQQEEVPDSLELGGKDILLPKASLGGGVLRVAYTDILEVVEMQFDGRRQLTISTTQGKARLFSTAFTSEARFVEFANLMIAKWKRLEPPRPPQKQSALPATQESPAETKATVSPADSAVLRAVQSGKAADPIIGAKFAGKEIFLRLTSALAKNDPRGVHSETLLCSLGALAGYACQASLRAQALVAGKPANSAFNVVRTKDGKEYFFGDGLNRLLAEDKLSVWSVAAGAAQHAGARTLPDLNEIFKHTAASVGSEAFGIVRYPGSGAAMEPPIAYLKTLWPVLLPPVRELTGDPKLWPLAYALAIQQAIELSKDSLGPEAALTIAMEAAVPMSKVRI
jgi:hypothetical protein